MTAAQHNVIPWQFPACHAGLFSGPKESLQVNNDQVTFCLPAHAWIDLHAFLSTSEDLRADA
eukprot:1050031-Amphidinium_carterae.1